MKITITKVDIRNNTERPDSKTRIYMFNTGETLIENITGGRWNNPVKELRASIAPQIFRDLDLTPGTKIGWSQRAGCSCGCSPGFVIQGHKGKEVFVDYIITESGSAQEVQAKLEELKYKVGEQLVLPGMA